MNSWMCIGNIVNFMWWEELNKMQAKKSQKITVLLYVMNETPMIFEATHNVVLIDKED